MRIRIVKNYKRFKEGDVIDTDDHSAERLVRLGIAIMSKDMTMRDMRTKGVNVDV